MRIWLAGEGPTELGDWGNHPANRSTPAALGLLEALLRQVRAEGWEVHGGIRWKDIIKVGVGAHRRAETRNVLGAALDALENGCDALVFVRDRDRDTAREATIERGVLEAKRELKLGVAGCLAVEAVEAWVLALRGEQWSEMHPARSRR